MKKQLLLILSVTSIWGLILAASVFSDSLYSDNNSSLYNTSKKPEIGDVIIVKVSTQSSALQKATTDTTKDSNVGLKFYRFEDLYDGGSSGSGNDSQRSNQDFNLGGRGSYYGRGTTQRASQVRAKISAVVTDVLENGNLLIVGERKVNVNDETEYISLSGMIRAQDIQADNSVYSHQIAQAQVSVKGDGVVGSKQTPGFMSKMFGWLF